jgi:Cu+-exporting ATPase
MPTDPVCGMAVDGRTAELTLVRENRTYYFCSSSCLEEFSAPERQLARLRLRLAVSWPLSVAILLVTYLFHFPDWPYLAFALATVVEFYPGYQFYRGTWDALHSRLWNMDVLIAVGTTVAYGYSSVVLWLPGHLPTEYYFDASSLIVTLILTGNYLEHLTRERSRGALRELQELVPTTVRVLRQGTEVEVPVSEVRPGDLFRVRPGGRVPVDGRIREGRSTLNEALLTGEGVPVERAPGDRVLAGTINGSGLLTVEATRVGQDTLLAQIGQLVAEAEVSRVPLKQLADRIAAIFVPVVLALAGAASVGWFLGGAGLTVALLVFVSVAITACPCAFGIATPAAIVVGTGRAAEEGILFKGRDSLEQASRIDLVLTDKTGTLTRGEPALTDLVPAPGETPGRLLALSAGLESGSSHPLARAVQRAARDRGVPGVLFDRVEELPGQGVQGFHEGTLLRVLRAGPRSPGPLLPSPLAEASARLEVEGRTWSVVLQGDRPLGLLGFADEIAPGVPEAVQALARDGIRVVMATGDHQAAAQAVARQAGIDEVHAGLSPSDKLSLLRRLREEGHRVAYVGDGINDAPALAAADLGIAIGAGTDVAKEAGGVILVRSDFRGVALALRTGRRTVGKVRGNLVWALGYNAVLLPIAAGALVPVFGLGVYDVLPITGALAMGVSSTTVVLNSLSLRLLTLAR